MYAIEMCLRNTSFHVRRSKNQIGTIAPKETKASLIHQKRVDNYVRTMQHVCNGSLSRAQTGDA